MPIKNKKRSDSSSVAGSAGVVGIAVMLSRVLGLIREMVFAGLFGAGTATDAFVVAFRIPNLLRDLFGEGALSAAFVRIFTEYDQTKSQTQTWQLASIALVFFACFLSIFTLLAIFFSDNIVHFYAEEFSLVEGKLELTVLLSRIMMPFMILISLAAIIMGILNTKGKFFIPALASSFFNLGSIIGGTGLALVFPHFDFPPIAGMAIGTLIGGFLQLAIQLPPLMRTGFRFKLSFRFNHPGLLRVLKLMIPAIIGLSATQINIFINTSFATSCIEGSVSWLQYSFRLVQLPVGVFGVAVGIAAMPLLSRFAAKKDVKGLKDTFSSSLTLVLCLTLPATAGLFFLAEPIIHLLFERGAFDTTATAATAKALALYSIGLFAYSSNKVIVPAFYALEKTMYPVMASFFSILTNIIFINFTIEYLQHLSIALSMSVTMIINFILLNIIFYYKIGGFNLKYLFQSTIKIGMATVVMSCFLILANSFCRDLLLGSLLQCLLSLFSIIVLAASIYGITAYILRIQEWNQALKMLKRKISK